MSLNIASEKDLELKDTIQLVKSVESCCFRKTSLGVSQLNNNAASAAIKAVEPPKGSNNKLLNQRAISGWIKSKRNTIVFNAIYDVYLSNQYYWEQKYSKNPKKLSDALTDLEIWFMCIIEPPPNVPVYRTTKDKNKFPLETYACDLDDWLKRENLKYKFVRSYYCPDKYVPLLKREKLLEHQEKIISHYQLVKEYYQKQLEVIQEIEIYRKKTRS